MSAGGSGVEMKNRHRENRNGGGSTAAAASKWQLALNLAAGERLVRILVAQRPLAQRTVLFVSCHLHNALCAGHLSRRKTIRRIVGASAYGFVTQHSLRAHNIVARQQT
jgi:hypothetical protein